MIHGQYHLVGNRARYGSAAATKPVQMSISHSTLYYSPGDLLDVTLSLLDSFSQMASPADSSEFPFELSVKIISPSEVKVEVEASIFCNRDGTCLLRDKEFPVLWPSRKSVSKTATNGSSVNVFEAYLIVQFDFRSPGTEQTLGQVPTRYLNLSRLPCPAGTS